MNTNRSILWRADRCPRSGGFTLIEMLVVIAIITLLAAMLLPTLSKARAQARSTACKNHLSQIGRAMAMYLTDHNRYPPLFGKSGGLWGDSLFPRAPWNSGGLWADRLYPYAPLSWTNGSWNCPTYIANQGILGSKKDREGRTSMIALSYGYNGYGVGGVLGGGPKLGLGAISPQNPQEQEVQAPSEMYTVADARSYTDKDGDRRWFGRLFMDPWLPRPGFILPEADPPHSQGYNILFGDEHVSLVKRSDYLYPPRTAHNWNRDNQPHPETWAPKNQWAVQQ